MSETEEGRARSALGHFIQLCDRGEHGVLICGPVEPGVPIWLKIGRGFTIGHDKQRGLHRGMTCKESLCQQEPVVQVSTLFLHGWKRGELINIGAHGIAAKGDNRYLISAKARADQMMQRQGSLLHWYPAAFRRHGVAGID